MKKILIILIIVFSLILDKSVLAQQPPPPTSTAADSPPITNPIQTSGVQQTAKSNTLCVKVGEPTNEKPDACNEPQSAESGFVGPIAGDGPTAQYCGDDPMGNPLMCYKPAYVFYCQGDPRWANVPDRPGGPGCYMIGAGCGPSTMAMIFSAFGDTITPLQMDQDIFRKRGWRGCGDVGSSMQLAIQTLLPENGYEVHALGAPLNLNRAQEYLNAGYLIIGSTSNHIFAIDGVNTSAGTVKLRDPARCENKDGVTRPALTPWNGEALTYSYAVKKKPK